jgi:2-dehydropantoate 2-reductase
MRILVVGAGAVGGYFGGCLLRAGREVRFLVRTKRAEQLDRDGLRIVSPNGDFALPAPTLLADAVTAPFDVVLVALKSFSLDEAVNQLAPAIGPSTAILPVINGMAHIDSLSARFGADRVLGGTALISATLDSEGRVIHLFPNEPEMVFGELAGGLSERTAALSTVFAVAGFKSRASELIMQDMWEKWTILGTNAAITCLMRASIRDIIAASGGSAILRVFKECSSVAEAAGFKPRPAFAAYCTNMFTQAGSPMKASMLRDIERGAPTEGEHVLGDLLQRARLLGVETPLLGLAETNVAAYELGRAR